LHDQPRSTSGGALVAIDARTRAVIGMSRFHGYEEERKEIEIGWTFVARSHWGGIYNRETKHLMLSHALQFVRSVVFVVDPHNLRSQRAVEKIGGVPVGSRLDGGGRPSVAYRIDASTFDGLIEEVPTHTHGARSTPIASKRPRCTASTRASAELMVYDDGRWPRCSTS
jgi:RimJ/RimL family protein N-acetyltransferase